MRLVVLVLAMVAASPALAALSGFYDSAEKIGMILGSAEVADALRQAPVAAVKKSGTTADGAEEWTVRTQDCDLVVALTAVPPAEGMVGKTTYALRIVTPCT